MTTDKKPPQKSIVLVGMMGSGKSAIGEALAKATGLPFTDSDAVIVSEVNAEIPDIFKYQGEAYFRKKEKTTIKRVLNGAPCVLATGGGAFCQTEIRDLCQPHFSVYLDVPLMNLWRRVSKKKDRPLAQAGYKAFGALLESRQADYRSADIAIDCKGKTKKQIAQEILSALPPLARPCPPPAPPGPE